MNNPMVKQAIVTLVVMAVVFRVSAIKTVVVGA